MKHVGHPWEPSISRMSMVSSPAGCGDELWEFSRTTSPVFLAQALPPKAPVNDSVHNFFLLSLPHCCSTVPAFWTWTITSLSFSLKSWSASAHWARWDKSGAEEQDRVALTPTITIGSVSPAERKSDQRTGLFKNKHQSLNNVTEYCASSLC